MYDLFSLGSWAWHATDNSGVLQLVEVALLTNCLVGSVG